MVHDSNPFNRRHCATFWLTAVQNFRFAMQTTHYRRWCKPVTINSLHRTPFPPDKWTTCTLCVCLSMFTSQFSFFANGFWNRINHFRFQRAQFRNISPKWGDWNEEKVNANSSIDLISGIWLNIQTNTFGCDIEIAKKHETIQTFLMKLQKSHATMNAFRENASIHQIWFNFICLNWIFKRKKTAQTHTHNYLLPFLLLCEQFNGI